MLLDPPYAEGADNLYGNHDKSVSAKVREWAIANGDNRQLARRFALDRLDEEDDLPVSDNMPMGHLALRDDGRILLTLEDAEGRDLAGPNCLKPGDATGF